jgi:hypothetical protein
MSNGHLTNEQLSDLLTCTNSASRDHLKVCSQCRGEVECLSESLGAVNHLGLLWAEHEARRRVPLPLPAMERWRTRTLWAVPATLAVVWVVILIVNQTHRRSEIPQADVTPSPAYTVADDNLLMANIDRALNAEIAPQVPVSELRRPSESAHGYPAPRMVN